MKKISMIFLMFICLIMLIFTGCEEVGITPGIENALLEYSSNANNGNANNNNNPSINNPNSNNYQEPSIDPEVVETDTTKPIITGSRAPLPNSFGWNNSNVTVSFSCEDVGAIQSGISVNTVEEVTVSTEGENQSVTNTGECIDVAGNIAEPATVSDINIDKTPPVVVITLPGTGEYILNESVEATWIATDTLSGVVSPVFGTLSIDTGSAGTKTITLPEGIAKDKAGNNSLAVMESFSVIASVEDPDDPNTVYPQTWATGTGTIDNPWANDCIQKAYDAAPVGSTIFLQEGYYQLSSTVSFDKEIHFIGEGINKTIIKTSPQKGFQINANQVTLKRFTVDGNLQPDEGGICINASQIDYLLLEDIEVKNSGYYGINLNDPNNCTLRNIQAHDNYRHGVHAGANEAGRNKNNLYENIYCYNNGVNGFDERGSLDSENNTYTNLQCHDNSIFGIVIAHLNGGNLSNSDSHSNSNIGIVVSDVNSFDIDNCSSTSNVEHGIEINTSNNINLTNSIVKNNCSGIIIDFSSSISIASCESYDDRVTPLQKWGVELTEISGTISVSNCNLSPNKEGEIYDPAGVAVRTDMEKTLAKF